MNLFGMDTPTAPTVIKLVTPATCGHVWAGWIYPPDHEPPCRRCIVCGLREEKDQ